MFKIFGVGEDKEETVTQDLEIDVINSNEEIKEENIGQVALDILESESDIYIVAPIAGVLYEEIDLSINKTILTIKGTREKPQEYNIDGIKTKNEECFWGKFIRNIILPENLAFDKIRAYMQNNLLVITIPKLKYDVKTVPINRMEV